MLRRIYIDGFRALVNFELRPGRLNLFLGESGSGKTSVFEAMMAVHALVLHGTSVSDVFALKRTRWESRDSIRIELDVEGNGGTYAYVLVVQVPLDLNIQATLRSETITFDGSPIYAYADGQVQLYLDDGAKGPLFPYRPQHSFLANVDRLGAKLSWFKTFLSSMIVLRVNPWAMDLLAQNPLPVLSVKCSSDKNMPYDLFLADLSDGQRVLAVLYSALYALEGGPDVFWVDEPANFVALPEIQPWLQELRDWSSDHGGQAFLASHHPEVIDYLAGDSAFRFDRPDGTLVRVRPFEPKDDIGLRPSELIARGELARRCA